MKMTRTLQVAAPLAALIVATAHGQVGRGTTEWLTAGGDAQRTYWVRADPKISVASMSKPGFERQWSVKLDNRVRGVNGLTHGVSANGVTLLFTLNVVPARMFRSTSVPDALNPPADADECAIFRPPPP